MFERRLKIVFWIMACGALALVGRAGQIQIAQKDRWTREAADLMTRRELIETTRGRLLDCRGRELAVDEPCMDACVEYPAVTDDPDESWLLQKAEAAAMRRWGQVFTAAKGDARRQMLAEQMGRVRQQLRDMWGFLAKVSGQSQDKIDEIRRSIIERVEMRRQFVCWQNFQKAVGKFKNAPPTWYGRWLPTDNGPILDDYFVDVAEESEAHVILPAVSTDEYNQLAKNAENLPGLVLRPGTRRVYPFAQAACHVVGHLAAVGPTQMKDDPDMNDPLRKYWPIDLAGEDGAEALCEQVLRGTRGEQTRVGAQDWSVTSSPVPGNDARLTLDIQLQSDIERAFAKQRTFHDEIDQTSETRENQPGAAVVIDLAHNNVLALVSYPLFDPNKLDTDYAKLSVDDLNQPLANRALEAYQPGSIVKPLMGLGALADGVITPTSTIECTGYLILRGHRYETGKCWTLHEFGYLIAEGIDPTHHKIPTDDPHPTGFLTVSDAIERSCNVFFETVADRMGIVRQHYWYDRFGLGRPTGIGLPEKSGHVPSHAILPTELWFAGIGQGSVLATPLQMANAAATIARDGVWMRPRLVDDGGDSQRVNLGFSPEAIAAVKEGMDAVVNKRAGTGPLPHGDPPDDVDALRVAAKTGTPQVSRLTVPVRDNQGHIIVQNGQEKRILVDPNDPAVRTWYIGSGKEKSDYAHAWYVGYVPADHPRIAFAVFAEYGGSGGKVAGAIVRDLLAACVKQGYLQ
jgi:penicillin-binding protein 2